MTTKAFWNRVKKMIKAHNMTQKEFAQQLDMPLSTFQGMMHHNRVPVLDIALDMAKILGVTVEYLAYGKDTEITSMRLKELSNEQSATAITKLATQIQKESAKIQNKKNFKTI